MDETGYTVEFSEKGRYFKDVGECTLFPSKEQRDWSKFEAPWYKDERLCHHTLKPFDKVLVRSEKEDIWHIEIFSHMMGDSFVCLRDAYPMCIPFNEDTKHLIYTYDDAPDYYVTWE